MNIKTKKGQSDLVYTIGMILAVIFFMIIMIKLTTEIQDKFIPEINKTDAQAAAAGVIPLKTFNSFADSVTVIIILFNILLLFIFSFLSDIHPVFMVLYLILAVLTVIFTPIISNAIRVIYLHPDFATAANHLQATYFILDHFGIITLIIVIITGVILYAKIRTNQTTF